MAGNYGKMIETQLAKGDYAFVEQPPSLFERLKEPKVIALVTLLIVAPLVIFTLPYALPNSAETFAVVFDAGSTGSRVHVFRFQGWGPTLDLQEETFEALKPGFRAYAANPKEAADSLLPLIQIAKDKVPESKWATTPLTLRATAGLRLLPEGQEAADAIMKEVKDLLQSTGFLVKDDYVSILGGDLEGAFGWLCVNYLLGKLGGNFEHTVAMTDMGGGSLQMAYAVSDDDARDAPEGYIQTMSGLGNSYNVYVNSYAGYGIMAGRAKILKAGADPEGTHPCAPEGLDGGCEAKCYGLQPTDSYHAKGRENGGDFEQCVDIAKQILEKNTPCVKDGECSFAGSWAPPIKSTLYGMSYIYERPVQSLAVEPEGEDAQVSMSPEELKKVGPTVCGTRDAEILEKYPEAERDHFSYLCLDVAYQYALLTEGFGIKDDDKIELLAKIPYKGQEVEAAWPLGDALVILENVNDQLSIQQEAVEGATK
mmetsp:Transcript_9890/g.11418  ORF Transcript_9890/g.11418 Transcript_9890/m.11418 type:complete len:482 (+) Transcript_9890:145-1590(+)|eukprot:CAMPEP_0197854760 /NCGR_PEP_ID=MMETSP1438-20131217/25278_1 /TAXON_ID=1461541 /ORGANISM="Pterosperma sp., Strain CCMP1384" /LENGTH=481 /DNA_ID=CAMNT_0043469619 /DNA_START=140 /DNA_END=1585 /DNA_ORIENTATION=-